MTLIKNGFFAYSSKPEHCGEFIEEAIKDIHKSGHLVSLKSWKSMSVAGKFIISEILKEIEKCTIRNWIRNRKEKTNMVDSRHIYNRFL